MDDLNKGTYKWENNLLILSCGCKLEFDSYSFDLIEAEYCKFHTKAKFH